VWHKTGGVLSISRRRSHQRSAAPSSSAEIRRTIEELQDDVENALGRTTAHSRAQAHAPDHRLGAERGTEIYDADLVTLEPYALLGRS
jgi:hypothetical protein